MNESYVQPDVPEANPVLDPKATETQLARLVQSALPPLRCVDEDWYVYRAGVWDKTRRSEFKPLALSIQHEAARTARKATEILKHVEFSNQTNGKEFRSFLFEKDGEIFLNCAHSVLAVSPEKIRKLPHSEKYFFTKKLAAAYNPSASAPNFEKALQEALPDPADIESIQYFAGYILFPDFRFELALICYGDSDTAKSTVSTGIEAALGEGLVTKCSLTQISNPESKNLAKLGNSALNLLTELDAVEVGSEIFKLVVSGEGFDADRKYLDSVTLRATCKLWFNANHLPRFKHGTDAEIKRARIVRFDQKVPTRDDQLKERIKTEADGVLIFMLDGLRRLMKEKRFPIESAKSAKTKERFKLQNDHIGAFVSAECTLGPDREILKDQLHDAYRQFGESNGIFYHKEAVHFCRDLYARYPDLKPFRDPYKDGTPRPPKIRGIDTNGDD
jgi:putative DNA primase/helicase